MLHFRQGDKMRQTLFIWAVTILALAAQFGCAEQPSTKAITWHENVTGRRPILDGKPIPGDQRGPWDRDGILDAIAFIHLADFPVEDAQRLAKSRKHLLAMISASRKSWKLIEAETDNHREWIPGPEQQSVVEGVGIDQERLEAWRRFLDEAEAVLNGQKLIPSWRGTADRGVKLRRVFTETKNLDLVLWGQGSGAVPYLEEGELSSPETRNEFQGMFGGRFVGFAIWIN